MYFVYFSWWRNQNFRVLSSTEVKVATVGRTSGVWNDKDSSFKFKLPAGVCTAYVSFMGTTGIHEFHFTTDSAEASHVAWEHIDYNHTSDAFLLERAFTYRGKHPQVVELPLPRVSGFTKFHNPTRPSHLVGGALVRCRRSYSPSEIGSIRAVGLGQSPAYFSRRVRSMSRTPDREDRARSFFQPRSTSSPGSFRSREHSMDRSMFPFQKRSQRILPPKRRESGSASIGSRSRSPSRSPPHTPLRSPSPSKRRCPKPVWGQQMRTLPVEHSKFIWDTVSYITSLQAFLDFAAGCDLRVHIMRRAIEDNDPSDGEVSLENCVAQALVIWWLSSNRPAVWKSNKVRQEFVKLHMPGIHSCLMKKHPTLDPNTPNKNSQNEPRPGPSGQMSKKSDKYQTMEYIVLHLKSYEFDFFKELSGMIQTPENAYGLACITNLPDPTFAHIRHEHTKFGLSVKEIHGRIALHILGIWYLQAKNKFHIIPMIMDMFRDLELYDECEEIFEIFPEMNEDVNRSKPTPKKVHMGTKLLKKGHKAKSSTIKNQGHCSSTSPLNTIRENGEVVEVEEQMPDLVDISDDGDTNGDQQPLITFGQARLTNMGDTTENLSQGVNVKFEVDNGNTEVSRDIPPNPHVLLKNLQKK